MAGGRNIRLVLLYVVGAALWIVGSDVGFSLLLDDASQLALAGALKGCLFVGVTALLLLRLLEHRSAAAMASALPEAVAGVNGRPSSSGPMLASAAALAAIVILIGAAVFDLLAGSIRHQETARLVAVAETKDHQIEAWLAEPTIHSAAPTT